MPEGRLSSPSTRLAALVTTLVALGPLSTDLYLPSLPTLASVFASDTARVQLTLSAFLAGFAVAQLAYGALSDRFGRRPLMLAGLLIYFLASIACLCAGSIEQLIAARFAQALGACAGPVLGRAIVRDAWGPLESARVLAYVLGAMALAPLVGPTIGGLLTVAFGWQASFVVLALISALQAAAVWRWLGETNCRLDPTATRPSRIFGNFSRLLGDRAYLRYLLALAFSYSGLFAFISGSSFVLIARFALSPTTYGLCFSSAVAGYIGGTQLAGRLVRRLGADRLIALGGALGATAGLSMLGLELAGLHTLAALLAPMFAVAASVGLVMPMASARALAPYPQMAGAAAALMGFAQMTTAALVGIVVGHGINTSPAVLPLAVAVCATLVPLCHFALRRPV
ncbi:MAG TPA: multidrug effflux MFS transporter [Accumulibacter sp.]|uniref:multidrug effflux MFS transporter n=1 Tax=Accumulibacter sp. TaxID=2053492 RepID=UPI002BA91AC4|nr:multidrug effflux MFS transporter [Accumulibacter sp.]HNB67105.1 multidrug effflux MFS transporter [Accumulibacter sp.]HNJ49740.1 multidrug effflux MFS transporter [Accumulibacter sp.]